MQRLYSIAFMCIFLLGMIAGCQSNESLEPMKQEAAASPSASSESKQQSKEEPDQEIKPTGKQEPQKEEQNDVKKDAQKEPQASKQEPMKTPAKAAAPIVEPKSEAEPKEQAPSEPTTSQKVSAPSSKSSTTKKDEPKKQTVSLSITGDTEIGTILPLVEVEVGEGDTVLDVLKRATKQKGIQMEFSGSGSTAYVEGIDNLYEFDKGPKSGWMYKVNGGFGKRSAGDVALKPGDRIEWLYTLDLGKDLKS